MSGKQHQKQRKENRESAQKKFRKACSDAKLTKEEMREFSHYFHDKGLNADYMKPTEIFDEAQSWATSKLNPYLYKRNMD